jgi:hypothetical protein
MMDIIKKAAIDKFGSFRKFAVFNKTNDRNFAVRIESYLNKLDRWIEPIGLEIVLKNRERKDQSE